MRRREWTRISKYAKEVFSTRIEILYNIHILATRGGLDRRIRRGWCSGSVEEGRGVPRRDFFRRFGRDNRWRRAESMTDRRRWGKSADWNVPSVNRFWKPAYLQVEMWFCTLQGLIGHHTSFSTPARLYGIASPTLWHNPGRTLRV